MLQSIGQNAQDKSFHARDRFLTGLTIGKSARNGGYFRYPAVIGFLLNFYGHIDEV